MIASQAPDRLPLFAFCWEIYLTLHQGMAFNRWSHADVVEATAGWLTLLTAIGVLAEPRSLPRFAALLAADFWQKVLKLPVLPNHVFFTMCVDATCLVTIARHALGRQSSRERGRAALSAELSALVRWELLILYGWVVLHKLNSDYFNPAVSCAVTMYTDIARWLPVFPTGDWLRIPLVAGTLACEAAIPILLVIPRTRVSGIGLGLVFHLTLGLHPNRYVFSFSAMMFALLSLFLPARFWVTVADWRGRAPRRAKLLGLAAGGLVVGVAGGGTLLALAAARIVDNRRLAEAVSEPLVLAVRLAWLALSVGAILIFAGVVRGDRIRRAERGAPGGGADQGSLSAAFTPRFILPVLVLFNGFFPYLGLKTESSFAMFSNLRTEGRTNHLLIPARLQVATYQDDVVEIIRSSDHGLQQFAGTGLGLTWLEVRRRAANAQGGNFFVEFRRQGQMQRLTKPQLDAGGLPPLSFWEQSFLAFRPVQLDDGPQQCRH